jgi:hypothetical protein
MKLKIKYMIGDAAGKTSYKADISNSNPLLSVVTTTLDNLVPMTGNWGFSFTYEQLKWNLDQGNITELAFKILVASRYDDPAWIDELLGEGVLDELIEEYGDYLDDFYDIFHEETEYSFLVYKGYSLK